MTMEEYLEQAGGQIMIAQSAISHAANEIVEDPDEHLCGVATDKDLLNDCLELLDRVLEMIDDVRL